MANPFSALEEFIDHALDDFVYDTTFNLLQWFTPVFTNLLLLWIVIWGLMMMLGYSGEPLKEGVARIIRIGFIMSIGLTVGTYNEVVVDFFTNAPSELSQALTGSTGTASSALDNLYNKVFDIADEAYDKGGIMNGNFGMYIMGTVVLGVGIILTLLMAAIIFLSKIGIAVVLALGPIFIAMLLFQKTQSFFEMWLKQLVNFGFAIVLATLVSAILINLSENYINNNNSATLANIGSLTVIFGFAIIVMRQVQPIASALGGGIAMATNGAISEGMSKLRPSNIKRGINKARNDVSTAYNAARAPDRKAAAWAKSGYAAYQRKFGRGNSISGG